MNFEISKLSGNFEYKLSSSFKIKIPCPQEGSSIFLSKMVVSISIISNKLSIVFKELVRKTPFCFRSFAFKFCS